MSCFSYYLLCFFFYKIENRRAEQVLSGVGRGLALERGERWWGKG
jgi:hypothetical protein